MTKALMLLLGIVSLAEAYHHHHHHQGIGKVVVGRRNARFPSLLSRQIELQLDLFPSFSPDDQWGLYSVVSTAAATALRLERTTIIGAGLSGPVTAMLITALLTNVGILPAAGSIHLINLQGFVLRLATPLLLLGADMRKIFRETGRMLQAFMLGTIGTLLGSFIAMLLLSGPIGTVGLPGDGWKVAAALTAKNIGGGLNFFAVTNALELSPASLAAGLAIDNLLGMFVCIFVSPLFSNPFSFCFSLGVGLCYFPFISWLGAPHDENNRWSKEEEEIGERKDVQLGEDRIDDTQRPANEAEKISILSSGSENQGIPPSTEHLLEQGDHRPADDVEKMMSAVAVATITAALAESISHALNVPSLSVPISTVLAVMFATLFPQQLNQLTDQGELLGNNNPLL